MNPVGFWWAAASDDEWPTEDEEIAEIQSRMQGEHGDRHQELVFIGQGLDQHRVEAELDRCLLTDLEFVQGPTAWADMEDPFPPIEIETEEMP